MWGNKELSLRSPLKRRKNYLKTQRDQRRKKKKFSLDFRSQKRGTPKHRKAKFLLRVKALSKVLYLSTPTRNSAKFSIQSRWASAVGEARERALTTNKVFLATTSKNSRCLPTEGAA